MPGTGKVLLLYGNVMPEGLYKEDPFSPGARAEFEEDLIFLCDRELDLVGDVGGLDVLYAGGSSVLWIEGLSQRIGEGGSLATVYSVGARLEGASELLGEASLVSPVRLVVGDVFEPPFELRAFDLIYSAGLFHELDVHERTAEGALAALVDVTRPGGRVSTSDFISSVPALQLEDEEIEDELAREVSGAELYGIGPPERLVALHEGLLRAVRWHTSPPYVLRHLDRLVLAEREPDGLPYLPAGVREKLCQRREVLLRRVRREGYTRPATLYVEGLAKGG